MLYRAITGSRLSESNFRVGHIIMTRRAIVDTYRQASTGPMRPNQGTNAAPHLQGVTDFIPRVKLSPRASFGTRPVAEHSTGRRPSLLVGFLRNEGSTSKLAESATILSNSAPEL
jgi:hypothetical protein